MKPEVGRYLIAKKDTYMFSDEKPENRCLTKRCKYQILSITDLYVYINSDYKYYHTWTLQSLSVYFTMFDLDKIKIL